MQPNAPQMPPGMPTAPTGGGVPPTMPPITMPGPKRRFNLLIIPVIALSVIAVSFAAFAFWAFSGRQDYKNNSDKKVAAAVVIAKKETETKKDNEFVEKEKVPHKVYQSPDTLGTVKFEYPKTWSAYMNVDQKTNGGIPLNGYLHPDYVPSDDSGTDFALRVEVISRPYSETLKQYEGKIKQGKISITPYKPEKVPSVLGVRLFGEIIKGQKDTMILLPIRDKTLAIWTESDRYISDYDKVVMSSLTFSP